MPKSYCRKNILRFHHQSWLRKTTQKCRAGVCISVGIYLCVSLCFCLCLSLFRSVSLCLPHCLSPSLSPNRFGWQFGGTNIFGSFIGVQTARVIFMVLINWTNTTVLTQERAFENDLPPLKVLRIFAVYHRTSNIRGTLVGNKLVYHSNVFGASPAGAAPNTLSFST